MRIAVAVDGWGEVVGITVSAAATVLDVKHQISEWEGVDYPVELQRLYHRGRELADAGARLLEVGLADGSELLLAPLANLESRALPSGIEPYGTSQWPSVLADALAHVRGGFREGVPPRMSQDGEGATYFLRSEGFEPVAVFKPQDEEPFMPNNSKGWVGTLNQVGFRPGVLSGEGCQREVAAYMLDHGNLAGVPATAMVSSWNEEYANGPGSPSAGGVDPPRKLGAFQLFIHYDGMAEDWSHSMFSVEDVQKIAILDIRLLNLDRNSTNILVRRNPDTKKLGLVPIDHGLCIPHCLEVPWYSWVWLRWRQLKEPVLPHLKEYIAKLDIDADIELLRKHLNIRPECLKTIRITGKLLQRGVAAGLTLFDIASMICRQSESEASVLELVCEDADQLVDTMFSNSRTKADVVRRMPMTSSPAGSTAPLAMLPPEPPAFLRTQTFDTAALPSRSRADAPKQPPASPAVDLPPLPESPPVSPKPTRAPLGNEALSAITAATARQAVASAAAALGVVPPTVRMCPGADLQPLYTLPAPLKGRKVTFAAATAISRGGNLEGEAGMPPPAPALVRSTSSLAYMEPRAPTGVVAAVAVCCCVADHLTTAVVRPRGAGTVYTTAHETEQALRVAFRAVLRAAATVQPQQAVHTDGTHAMTFSPQVGSVRLQPASASHQPASRFTFSPTMAGGDKAPPGAPVAVPPAVELLVAPPSLTRVESLPSRLNCTTGLPSTSSAASVHSVESAGDDSSIGSGAVRVADVADSPHSVFSTSSVPRVRSYDRPKLARGGSRTPLASLNPRYPAASPAPVPTPATVMVTVLGPCALQAAPDCSQAQAHEAAIMNGLASGIVAGDNTTDGAEDVGMELEGGSGESGGAPAPGAAPSSLLQRRGAPQLPAPIPAAADRAPPAPLSAPATRRGFRPVQRQAKLGQPAYGSKLPPPSPAREVPTRPPGEDSKAGGILLREAPSMAMPGGRGLRHPAIPEKDEDAASSSSAERTPLPSPASLPSPAGAPASIRTPPPPPPGRFLRVSSFHAMVPYRSSSAPGGGHSSRDRLSGTDLATSRGGMTPSGRPVASSRLASLERDAMFFGYLDGQLDILLESWRRKGAHPEAKTSGLPRQS